jgi:metal-sulfur cluster biosynthetic enzyme
MSNKKIIFIRGGLIILICAIVFSLYFLPGLLKRNTAKTLASQNIKKPLSPQTIQEALKLIKDPEMGINIVDLGLIKDITVGADKDVKVTMLLTWPLCPYVDVLIYEIRRQIKTIEDTAEIRITIDSDTVWHPDMITEQGKKQLGELNSDS